jgi:hypothetical protein
MEANSVPSSTTSSTQNEGFSSDAAYDILSYKRRRYAVHYLKQVDKPVEVNELAEQVAAWENSKTRQELTSQERKRVYVSLHQAHLSTLDDEGIINHDSDRGVVELTDATRETDVYLEVVSDEDIPWSYFYLGLSLAAGVFLGLIWYDISIFSDVSIILSSMVIVVAFGIASIIQTIRQGRAKLGDMGPPPEMKE